MLYLLNWRLWVLVGVLALFPLTYLKGRTDGKKVVRNEWQVATAQANQDARKIEQRRQDRADEAGQLSAKRVAVIRADADRARNDAVGLRGELEATRQYAAKSSEAAAKSVATLSAVLEECSRRFVGMAEAAAGHANDSLMYQESWPK